MNPYNVELTQSNLIQPMVTLKILYERMPETTGCESCKEVNGDKAQWCCLSQSPSMWYSEFIYIWRDVEKQWSKNKRLELILRAIRNYLRNADNKGCIFFDDGCQCYENRPFSCRTYGIVPKVNWEKREQVLKLRFGENIKVTPQCPLVKVKDKPDVPGDQAIEPEQEDLWYAQTKKAEAELGVPPTAIALNDNPGGSYRTFHDHLLLELFPLTFLGMLTKTRLQNPTEEDIDATLEILREHMIKEGVVSCSEKSTEISDNLR